MFVRKSQQQIVELGLCLVDARERIEAPAPAAPDPVCPDDPAAIATSPWS